MQKEDIFNSYGACTAIVGFDKSFDPNGFLRDYGYIDGYKTAADELVDKRFLEDLLVFPVVFCYRQYLELVLKTIFKIYSKLDFIAFLKRVGHDLQKLFDEVSPFLQSSCKLSQNEIDFIKAVIDDFCLIDPDSFSFRYPYTKRNVSTLDSKLSNNNELRINLRAMKKNIKGINDLLAEFYAA